MKTIAAIIIYSYLLTVQTGKHTQVVRTTDTAVIDSIAQIYIPCFKVDSALCATPFVEYRTKTATIYIERKTKRNK